MLNSILIIILTLIILYNLFNQSFKENLDNNNNNNNNNNMTYLEIINRLVSHPNIKDKPKEKKLIDFTREN